MKKLQAETTAPTVSRIADVERAIDFYYQAQLGDDRQAQSDLLLHLRLIGSESIFGDARSLATAAHQELIAESTGAFFANPQAIFEGN